MCERKRILDKIIKMANELAEEFLSCEPYMEYSRIKLRLEQNPELKEKIAEFEKTSDIYEKKRIDNEYVSFDDERTISDMYTDLWLSEDGRAYLESQKELCGILRRTLEIIELKCTL